MLVLSRKPNESIHIGNHVTVTVLSVHGGRVRLGIAAPPNVCIRRQEIQKADVSNLAVVAAVDTANPPPPLIAAP